MLTTADASDQTFRKSQPPSETKLLGVLAEGFATGDSEAGATVAGDGLVVGGAVVGRTASGGWELVARLGLAVDVAHDGRVRSDGLVERVAVSHPQPLVGAQRRPPRRGGHQVHPDLEAVLQGLQRAGLGGPAQEL